jgi:hypothetical protein
VEERLALTGANPHRACCRQTTNLGMTTQHPHAASGRLIEAFEKSSISAFISSSRIALAAWSMSIIMARWKWAPAPATAFRRWNVSRHRAVAEARPQCRADGRSWGGGKVCNPGHPELPGRTATH